jgi:hypothetical protein
LKLFVIGVVASLAIPLSSFFWEQKSVEPTITNYTVTYAKADPIPTPTPSPTPIVYKVLGDPYLNSLALSVGVTLPVYYGTCPVPGADAAQVTGCYYPGDDRITVTHVADAYGEEYISCVIVHEARHYEQYEKGLMNVEKGVITNRDWLESDAYNYAGC